MFHAGVFNGLMMLILSVPGPRKAEIVQRIMEEPISADRPATILRRHPNATLHLDSDSAVKLRFSELGQSAAKADFR
jgi:6-phosphogluconolactonase/glucosamine-6-phosphate isomerase/deaminase